MFTKFYIQSPDSFLIQAVQVAVKNMLVLRWNQRAHCFFCGRPKEAPKGTLEASKGTVPFGKVFFFILAVQLQAKQRTVKLSLTVTI